MLVKPLEHRIFEKPRYTGSHEVEPFKEALFIELNDERIIKNEASVLKSNIIWGIGIIIVGGWILEGFKTFDIYAVFVALIPLFGLFLLAHGIWGSKKNERIVLDRMNGTITYPGGFFRKPLHGKFKDLKAVIATRGNIDGYSPTEYLQFLNTFRPGFSGGAKVIYLDEPKKAWSFFVWYMDKNRPLPPGTAFDPYREKDLKRRNAEGNPPPLYPSNIETPYDTP